MNSARLKTTSHKDHDKVVRFAMKKAAKMPHSSNMEYNIVPSMQEEINFFRDKLQPNSGVLWETPIAFLIKRTPFAVACGDACLDGAGGYSLSLRFWWHLEFEEKVIKRTLKYLPNNDNNDLISINVLEFVTVIINYCAVLTILKLEKVTDDPHPILLNMTDNISALNWTRHTCKSSKIGKLLARFFCCIIMDSPLGINSEWISTHDNYIADDISRLKKQTNSTSSKHFAFDYSTIQQKYPGLKACRFYVPSPELLSLIWAIVLTEKWPTLTEVRTLVQSGLGKLSTSCGPKQME